MSCSVFNNNKIVCFHFCVNSFLSFVVLQAFMTPLDYLGTVLIFFFKKMEEETKLVLKRKEN